MFRNLTKILHFHSLVYKGCPPRLVEETDFTWVARINIEIILMDEKANKIFAPIKNVDPGKWNDVVKVEMVYDFILLDDVLTGNVNPDYLMEAYAVSIQNSMYGSKLFINEDLKDIEDYKNG
ncbi:hypothetical protein glysoja_041064 [Glycine soja]|uniref:Uncharacterized protein n=1 Tax=Glycine soja TaxID=3848 RepID=A0A0B2SF13_GLYSO|nr:hypothetical protein glysoja_041064 [Glycine soja]